MGTEAGYWSRVSRRRFLGTSLTAAAGLGAAALVGCSSSGGGTTPAPAASSSAPKASGPTASSIIGKSFSMREPDGVPTYGGTFNYASGTPAIPNLDPFSSTAAMTHQVASMVYGHLVHNSHPANDRNKLEYYPDLATSWEIGDPTKFTFKLREGVKWQNVAPLNGRPLTAEDVKFGINRSATDKASPYKGTLSAIKSIDTPDATTVVLNLKGFDAGLFPALADRFAWIVPKELTDSGALKQTMVGTGPFIFQKWEQDNRVNFKKNPDYYVKGTPFVDEVNFLQIVENQTRLAAFRSGQAQNAGIDRSDFDSIVADKKTFSTETYIAVGTSSIMMKYGDPRWQDDRVRQALAIVADRDAVLKIQNDAKGLWRGILSAQTSGWALSQDELHDPKYNVKQDLQKAKQLMTAAGNADGVASKLLYRTGIKQEEDFAQYWAETANKAGVAKISLVALDSATMRKQQDEHTYDGLVSGIDGEPLPEAFLLDFHSGGPKTGMNLTDKDLDAKIDKVSSIPDSNARKEAVLNLTREMLQKVYWKTNFTDNTANDQWRNDVHNYMGPLPQQYNQNGFAFLWLDKK